jgi:AraC family transcriptional regulator
MDVRIETIESMRVAYVRGIGPYATTLPRTWARLNELAGPLGLHRPGAWYLTICNDDPDVTPPDQVRGDACISCDAAFRPSGEVQTRTIPAGAYAVMRYRGPYSGLGAAWQALCGQWLPQRRLRIRCAPCFEVYRNQPGEVPESELLTEIYEPVEDASTG